MLVEAVVKHPTGATLTELLNDLQSLRLRREQEKLRVAKYYDPLLLSRSERGVLTPLIRDMIAFANVTGLYQRADSRYLPGDSAIELHNAFSSQSDRPVQPVLRFLFSSPYKAYYEFVRAMISNKGELTLLPALYGRQDSEALRDYMKAKGFLTDVASFFTLRDLYYDIGILNWFRNTKDRIERIYLTNQILNYSSLFSDLEKRELASLELRGVALDQFWRTILNVYSESGVLGNYANLLELRDRVCYQLRLSDQSFSQLLRGIREVASESGYRIAFASTPLLTRLPMGYVVKLENLPKAELDLLATRLRISYEGN